MNVRVILVLTLVVLCSALVFAQNPITADSSFQVRYAANLGNADSVVNITNTGAFGFANICVNVYAFSPDEQLIACCTCVVTPNGLVSLSARSDLISNTLTPAVPGAIVIKLYATDAAAACNASAPGAAVPGMAAWGTTAHAAPAAGTFALTETAFTPATLSGAELARITSVCGFIQSNGSGYGICRSCRSGALGGAKK